MSQHQPSSRILLVGRQAERMEKIESYLSRGGYQTVIVDYETAKRGFTKMHLDGAIIATSSADAESLAVCRHLRLHGGVTFPIMIVTPDESVIQPSGSLSQCADDFLLEPIDSETLLLRFSILFRRKQAQASNA